MSRLRSAARCLSFRFSYSSCFNRRSSPSPRLSDLVEPVRANVTGNVPAMGRSGVDRACSADRGHVLGGCDGYRQAGLRRRRRPGPPRGALSLGSCGVILFQQLGPRCDGVYTSAALITEGLVRGAGDSHSRLLDGGNSQIMPKWGTRQLFRPFQDRPAVPSAQQSAGGISAPGRQIAGRAMGRWHSPADRAQSFAYHGLGGREYQGLHLARLAA